MGSWLKYAEQCEDLLRQYDAAKTDDERRVLLVMAARKFDIAAALLRAA